MQHNKKTVTFQCKHCGVVFAHPNKNRKFCDPCKTKHCKTCGVEFMINGQQLEQGWGKYCSKKCEGDDHPHRHKKSGYWCVKAKGHPRAYARDYYYEHILVMEKLLGRYLDQDEIVHHKQRWRQGK